MTDSAGYNLYPMAISSIAPVGTLYVPSRVTPVRRVSARAEGSSEIDRRLEELRAEKGKEIRRQQDRIGGRSLEENRQITELRSRDTEVRGHEAAHISAGGGYIRGGASFSYQTGPDGHQYATGGEVGIDTAPIPGKPAETVAKMQAVRAAALAPAEPSAADAAVAGAAAEAMSQAQAELAAQNAEKTQNAAAPNAGASQSDAGIYQALRTAADAYSAEAMRTGGALMSAPGAFINIAA